jgi:hypothetical protein
MPIYFLYILFLFYSFFFVFVLFAASNLLRCVLLQQMKLSQKFNIISWNIFSFFLNIESVNVTSGIDGGGETRQSKNGSDKKEKNEITRRKKGGYKDMAKYTLDGG